jgi:hypothetical protein
MVREEQRDYIENFINFVGTFLLSEGATINEINIVEANLDILKERISKVKESIIKIVKDEVWQAQ